MSDPAKNPSKPKLKAKVSRGGVRGGTLQPPGFDGKGPKNPEREANQVAPRSGGLRPEISKDECRRSVVPPDLLLFAGSVKPWRL